MSFQAEVLNVFIASPSDVSDQRNEIEVAVYEWNSMYAQDMSVVLLPRRWEKDVAPAYGHGNPQGLINEQVVYHSDIVIGIFWHRLGFPTKTHPSGTLEEIDHFINEGKDVLIYFVDQDKKYDSMDYEQAGEVQKYRKKYQSQGVYHEYINGSQIKNDLYRTVQKFLAKNAVKNRKEIIDLIPDNSQINSTPSIDTTHVKADVLDHMYLEDAIDSGIYDFDYSDNDGKFGINTWLRLFDTQWSRASNTAIHVYAIDGICEIGFNATDPKQLSIDVTEDNFNFSSKARTLKINEVVLFRYDDNDSVLVKVLKIEDRMSGDSKDRLSIEFIYFQRPLMAE